MDKFPALLTDQLPDRVKIRSDILALEEECRQMEQVDFPLTHTFAPGAYARTIQLFAGKLVIGKIHRHAHLNIVSNGHVTVVTEYGRMDIKGPHVFTSQPGTKRALYVHTDTVWTTIHLTDSQDLAQIEREIIAPTYDDLPEGLLAECQAVLKELE